MTVDTEKDLKWLSLPGNWPAWPVCPVKRWVRGEMTCGLVFDHTPIWSNEPKATPIVHELNMFIGWTVEQYNAAKKYEYNSFEAMLADGWMVD